MLLFAGMELCLNLSLITIYNSTLTGCYSHLQKKSWVWGSRAFFTRITPKWWNGKDNWWWHDYRLEKNLEGQIRKNCVTVSRAVTPDKPNEFTTPTVLLVTHYFSFSITSSEMASNTCTPADIYVFKASNGNTRTICEISETLIDAVLISLLLTLNKFLTLFSCFHYWSSTSK